MPPSLTRCSSKEPSPSRVVTCSGKWILSDSGGGQLSAWTEKKPQGTSQSQTCTKKRPWSLVESDPPVARPSRQDRHARSRRWSAGRAQFFAGPLLTTCGRASASRWTLGLHSCASSSCSPTPRLQAPGQLFVGEALPRPAGLRRCFHTSAECGSLNFCATGVNKLISPWQNMLIVMVPVLMNRDVILITMI